MVARLLRPLQCIVLIVAGLASSAAARPATLLGVGSDTMRELMSHWGDGLAAQSGDEVTLEYVAVGSALAPSQLVDGNADIIAMSRGMTVGERDAFRRSQASEPLRITVALDAVGIYVHRDNPLRGITMQQLDAMFSTSRKCAAGWFTDSEPIDEWSDLSFTNLGGIRRYGRSTDSGTYDFFREVALCGGDFRPEVLEMRDSAAIVEAVAKDPNGIGFAGIGFRDERVRVLALSPSSTFFEAPYYSYVVEKYRDSDDLEKRHGWVVRGKYPLSRELYLYLPSGSGNTISADAWRFADFALSREGQAAAHAAGFIPLPARMARHEARVLADRR
jgi:phosphate transport system substrate-binding protein